MYFRSSKNLTPTRKVNVEDGGIDNETYTNQLNKQNIVNFNVPPTPKKQKKVTTTVETEKICHTSGR